MVNKKNGTEYMKKFKDPKWEEYGQCYEEMIKYRLGRRLWEQAHQPWLWEGWENGSSSSDGGDSPQEWPVVGNLQPVEEGPGGTGVDIVEGLVEQHADGEESASDKTFERDVVGTKSETQEYYTQSSGKEPKGDFLVSDYENLKKTATNKGKQHSNPKQSYMSRAVLRKGLKSISPLTAEMGKGRHPFALYGWAEKQSEVAHKKTYNVCPAASTNEIHESALRAKTRHQLEKRMRMQNKQQTQALGKANKSKNSTEENPWLSEYMRCFSARTL